MPVHHNLVLQKERFPHDPSGVNASIDIKNKIRNALVFS